MKNNYLPVFMFGFLTIIVAAIISKKTVEPVQPVVQTPVSPPVQTPVQPPVQQQAPIIIQPAPVVVEPVYPIIYSNYHNTDLFWRGYSDGYNGCIILGRNPEYIRGYEIGMHDRNYRKPYYYDRYCPPGFSVRIPGFSLNIR